MFKNLSLLTATTPRRGWNPYRSRCRTSEGARQHRHPLTIGAIEPLFPDPAGR